LFAALASRLLPFAGRLLLTFLIFLALWPFVSPLYARAMAVAGGTVLSALSVLPPGSHLEARDRRVWVFRPVTKVDGSAGTAGVNVLDDNTYFNFVLLVSLIVATPFLSWTRKAKAACLGAAALGLLHLVDLYIKLKWTAIYPGLRLHGVVPEPASPATLKILQWIYAFFSVLGFGLFPILVWIGAVSLWWPRRGEGDGSTRRSARSRGQRRSEG
jgi:hypothetical protein